MSNRKIIYKYGQSVIKLIILRNRRSVDRSNLKFRVTYGE